MKTPLSFRLLKGLLNFNNVSDTIKFRESTNFLTFELVEHYQDSVLYQILLDWAEVVGISDIFITE